jgi:hypothetical protein
MGNMMSKNAPITLAQLEEVHRAACDLLVWINGFQLYTRSYRKLRKAAIARRKEAAGFLATYDAKLKAGEIILRFREALCRGGSLVRLNGQPATSFHEAVFLLALSLRQAIDDALHEAACEAELSGADLEKPDGPGLHAWASTSWNAMLRVLADAPTRGTEPSRLPEVATWLELERISCIEKYGLREARTVEIDWDVDTGNLTVERVTKAVFSERRRAPEQEEILTAFQRADWPLVLELADISPMTLQRLNERLSNIGLALRFHGDGTGKGIRRSKS